MILYYPAAFAASFFPLSLPLHGPFEADAAKKFQPKTNFSRALVLYAFIRSASARPIGN
jgi:hypothetical protein